MSDNCDDSHDVGFDFDKIMENCNLMNSIQEQINYLKRNLIEFRYARRKYPDDFVRIFPADNLDYYVDANVPVDFPDWIKTEIAYRKVLLNLEQNNSHMIRWKGRESQIVRLVEVLVSHGLLDVLPRYTKSFIVKHFVNRQGKPFKNKQLYEAAKKSNADTDQVIVDIVKQVVDTDDESSS